MHNKLLIEVNQQDHAFVESVCSEQNYTFASFFSHLLDLYKNSISEDKEDPIKEAPNDKVKTKKKKE